MREIIAGNTNIILLKGDDGKWHPTAEVVLISVEPRYHIDEDLELKKRRRDCEQFRFFATAPALTSLIDGLRKTLFEIENQTHAACLANNQPIPNIEDEAA